MARFVPSGASLYNQFDAVVKRQGLCVAIVTENQTITYVALRTAIDNCAAILAARGVRRGQSVAVHFTRLELYMIALFATNRIGAGLVLAAFPDAQNMSPKPQWLLTDDRMPPAERRGALVIDQTWSGAQTNQAPAPASHSSDNLVYVFGTSGSTGKRKYLRVSEKNLLTRMPSQQYYIDEETRLLCTIGSQTFKSTILHLTTLLCGGSAVLLPPQVQNLPYYIDLFGVNTLLTTPMILEDLITLNLPKDIYRTLECVGVTGVAASQVTLEKVADRICGKIILSYGSTEMGGTARIRYNKDEFVPGIVGKIASGIDVEIVDETRQPVDRGTEGAVRIRREGVLVALGYSDSQEEDNESFIDDWFYPGDRGWLDAESNLVISGRDDNVINAGGNKYGLELIESEIEAKLGSQCLVMLGEGPTTGAFLIVFVQSKQEVQPKALVDFVHKRFKRVSVERIYTTEAIEMTETGKKDRMKMARLLEEEPTPFHMVYQL